METIKMFLIEYNNIIFYVCCGLLLLTMCGILIYIYYLDKKTEKRQEEFIRDFIACAMYDSKYRINEYEVARKK